MIFIVRFCLALVFRGVGAGCNTKEILDRLRNLKAEIGDLELKEKELDQQKVWLQQSINNVMDDSENKLYPFFFFFFYWLLKGLGLHAAQLGSNWWR